jgi:type IV secretion system protein VirB1
MDLLTLIAQCAPMVAPATMAALIQVESAASPFAIHDGGTGRSLFPQTREEAVATARRLLAEGHRIDAGLTQINSDNWAWLDLSVVTVFDPCTNLHAGERLLLDAYRRGPHTLDAALSRYNTGHASKGVSNGYAGKVMAHLGKPFPQGRSDSASGPWGEGEGAGPVKVHARFETGAALADAAPGKAEKPEGPGWRFEPVADGFGEGG